jgi:hypothetical protein
MIPEYLPEPNIRTLINKLQKAADKQSDEYRKRHWLRLIESLAWQIKDLQLFEKTLIASYGKLSTSACVDIARIYLDRGDAQTAMSWLERIPADETHMAQERDRLMLHIHGQL